MFRRTFMKDFQVRKYARPSTYGGSITSNIHLLGKSELRIKRITLLLGMTFVMISATGDFEIFYEIVKHTKQPYHRALYEDSIPKEVKIPNEEIIENYHTIDEMKQFLKVYDL